MVLYPVGSTKASEICSSILQKKGITIVDHPTPEITHLLLDVPSFSADGCLRDGGSIGRLLPMLPEAVSIIGGNLKHPALVKYRCIDLLKDEIYLAHNAAITADCSLKLVAPMTDFVFRDCRILIFGWGRIGKCLAQLLKNLGCQVTVAARKESDRAILSASGYTAVDYSKVADFLSTYRIVFNTVPHQIMDALIPSSCIGVELASVDGIQGETIITARGLPGRLAPESSGHLMADTILRLCREEKL